MTTAAQIVRSALQEISVQADEADIQPSEAQDAIFAMNNFMLDLDANGVSLGYTVVSDLGDDITIPAGAIQGLIKISPCLWLHNLMRWFLLTLPTKPEKA